MPPSNNDSRPPRGEETQDRSRQPPRKGAQDQSCPAPASTSAPGPQGRKRPAPSSQPSSRNTSQTPSRSNTSESSASSSSGITDIVAHIIASDDINPYERAARFDAMSDKLNEDILNEATDLTNASGPNLSLEFSDEKDTNRKPTSAVKASLMQTRESLSGRSWKAEVISGEGHQDEFAARMNLLIAIAKANVAERSGRGGDPRRYNPR